ncbi:DUF2237 domain-containing protein [Aquisalimonas sp. 2447]|uniref:DUF2237 family protein n=1 Tax=Aquisalimonas sp. 2447 TaxID=2740807 RepID=UPI0014325D00|nr:DUF2237 domain-containing protein [Aquisalimonas sp. 2447]QIT54987.1 DUF2237 domain-containing protein [Aquisalimonas sp. 2447]
MKKFAATNIRGKPLQVCGTSPMTGFFRDGCCNTGHEDAGMHTVCARVTAEFLEFSKNRGNDLTRAFPGAAFPGLQPGDRWCLCAARWLEAYKAGVAPPVDLDATHEETLAVIERSVLEEHAISE